MFAIFASPKATYRATMAVAVYDTEAEAREEAAARARRFPHWHFMVAAVKVD